MSTILEAIGDYLVTGGHGTLGTNIFLAMMPDTPDTLIAVHESQGQFPDFTMGAAATAVDKPAIQIICRATRSDYPTARDKAETLRLYLGAVTQTTISGINILRIEPQGGVMPLGEDENQRPMVSVNFDCMVVP